MIILHHTQSEIRKKPNRNNKRKIRLATGDSTRIMDCDIRHGPSIEPEGTPAARAHCRVNQAPKYEIQVFMYEFEYNQ